MLKIRQSYHGTGDRDGYIYEVYDENDYKFGNLEDVPTNCSHGDIVIINGELYIITAIYDSDDPSHENDEVMFYELEPYEFEAKFNLGYIRFT